MRTILGIQPVREALRAGTAVRRIQLDRDGGKPVAGLRRLAEQLGVRTEEVDRQSLDRIAKGGRHQGVIAEAAELELTPWDRLLDLQDDGLLVLLDGITDPQNFGAVIRSAVGLGAVGIVWGEHHAAPLSSATFRASAGAIEHARLCCVRSLPQAVRDLAEVGARTIGLAGEASSNLDAVDLTGKVALVIGAEGAGLRSGIRKACTTLARIPIGRIDSLNASTAAAIALYEAARQRS